MIRATLLFLLAITQAGDAVAHLPASAKTGKGETRVFIVRHAEKDTSVTCADKTSLCVPLTAAGTARAAELARLLKDQRLTKIFSTEYKRTQDTARPSDRSPSILQSVPAREHVNAIAAEIAKAPGSYLIVTHSDGVLLLLRKLLGNEQMAISAGAMPNMATVIDDPDYDNLFLVTLDASTKSCKHFFFGAKTATDLVITGCPAQGRLQ